MNYNVGVILLLVGIVSIKSSEIITTTKSPTKALLHLIDPSAATISSIVTRENTIGPVITSSTPINIIKTKTSMYTAYYNKTINSASYSSKGDINESLNTNDTHKNLLAKDEDYIEINSFISNTTNPNTTNVISLNDNLIDIDLTTSSYTIYNKFGADINNTYIETDLIGTEKEDYYNDDNDNIYINNNDEDYKVSSQPNVELSTISTNLILNDEIPILLKKKKKEIKEEQDENITKGKINDEDLQIIVTTPSENYYSDENITSQLPEEIETTSILMNTTCSSVDLDDAESYSSTTLDSNKIETTFPVTSDNKIILYNEIKNLTSITPLKLDDVKNITQNKDSKESNYLNKIKLSLFNILYKSFIKNNNTDFFKQPTKSFTDFKRIIKRNFRFNNIKANTDSLNSTSDNKINETIPILNHHLAGILPLNSNATSILHPVPKILKNKEFVPTVTSTAASMSNNIVKANSDNITFKKPNTTSFDNSDNKLMNNYKTTIPPIIDNNVKKITTTIKNSSTRLSNTDSTTGNDKVTDDLCLSNDCYTETPTLFQPSADFNYVDILILGSFSCVFLFLMLFSWCYGTHLALRNARRNSIRYMDHPLTDEELLPLSHRHSCTAHEKDCFDKPNNKLLLKNVASTSNLNLSSNKPVHVSSMTQTSKADLVYKAV